MSSYILLSGQPSLQTMKSSTAKRILVLWCFPFFCKFVNAKPNKMAEVMKIPGMVVKNGKPCFNGEEIKWEMTIMRKITLITKKMHSITLTATNILLI